LQTPHMEDLAHQGTTYTAYCPSPLCMPCRSAFMTGRRVHQIQTYSNCATNVTRDLTSYGAELGAEGVYSVHAGKSHVYCPPEELGFSELLGAGGFGVPGDIENRRNPLCIRKGAALRADGFGPDEKTAIGDRKTVDAAINWLENTGRALDQPWGMTVNINNPHFPHYTPQQYWDLYPEGGDLPSFGPECESAQHPRVRDLMAHFETGQFQEHQIRGLRRGYLGCVSFVDYQLGRLITALRAAGRYEDTNVIYTSDHGEMLGKFGLWWKCSLYEDSVRIPCIASGPDFSSGHRHPTPIDLHDIQASLFRSCGASRPADWVGIPLQDIPEDEPDRLVFSEYHGHGARASSFMVREGFWKYIHHIEAPHQLFDLRNDPDELTDLYNAEPAKAAHLERRLREICNPELENTRAEAFIEAQQDVSAQ
ncbi:MAG: sulfatase-like hydrolase/transferase, partial [Candidatus Latescibacteria bacterium]|nr:sulfatase-like hydrolase/transferase [Candidatus Latescibacterota bacterium]